MKFQCSLCSSLMFFETDQYIWHMLRIHGQNVRETWKHCPFCLLDTGGSKQYFPHLMSLDDHLRNYHPGVMRSEKCDICEETLTQSYFYHLFEKHEVIFQEDVPKRSHCVLCPAKTRNETMYTENELFKHINECHQSSRKIGNRCSTCKTAFPTLTQAEAHEKIVHKSRMDDQRVERTVLPKKCVLCKEEFDSETREEDIRIHVRESHSKHTNQHWLFCPVCKVMSFNCVNALDEHFVEEHGSKFAFQCPGCLQQFPSRFATLSHKKTCDKGSSDIFTELNIVDVMTGGITFSMPIVESKFIPLYFGNLPKPPSDAVAFGKKHVPVQYLVSKAENEQPNEESKEGGHPCTSLFCEVVMASEDEKNDAQGITIKNEPCDTEKDSFSEGLSETKPISLKLEGEDSEEIDVKNLVFIKEEHCDQEEKSVEVIHGESIIEESRTSPNVAKIEAFEEPECLIFIENERNNSKVDHKNRSENEIPVIDLDDDDNVTTVEESAFVVTSDSYEDTTDEILSDPLFTPNSADVIMPERMPKNNFAKKKSPSQGVIEKKPPVFLRKVGIESSICIACDACILNKELFQHFNAKHSRMRLQWVRCDCFLCHNFYFPSPGDLSDHQKSMHTNTGEAVVYELIPDDNQHVMCISCDIKLSLDELHSHFRIKHIQTFVHLPWNVCSKCSLRLPGYELLLQHKCKPKKVIIAPKVPKPKRSVPSRPQFLATKRVIPLVPAPAPARKLLKLTFPAPSTSTSK